MNIPDLTPEQEAELKEAEEHLRLAMLDVKEEGYNLDDVFYDMIESVAYDITDPLVRREFHRIHGAYDRQTGYDPMEGV